MIDFRSDTITKPTDQMRLVIANAEVGDDVFGDDPTVKALEESTAGLLGKQAAVYMPSGTMANQVAVACHTSPGDEIVLDANAHLYYYEAGAPAAISGVMCRLIDCERGIFSAGDVEKILRPEDQHFARTSLICIENTTNRGGGAVWPIEEIMEITALARSQGINMHLDGARLWNASAASGISEDIYASLFDSVSVCFSKGLGAPIGSVLAGDEEFIYKARRKRKQLGGSLRQVGMIAAGALYALGNNRDRLSIDHDHAQRIAVALAEMPGVDLDIRAVETNIVIFKVTNKPAAIIEQKLRDNGIDLFAIASDRLRIVTNLNVSSEQVDQAIEIFGKIFV